MKLLIGNKNYSSWSLRPWLVLAHFELPFDEEMLLLNGEGWKERMLERSPTGRVPVLIDGDLVVPETLAIIEYLAEKFDGKNIWPAARSARALARAAAAEMHAGFGALRAHAPMNLRAKHLAGHVDPMLIANDILRLERLWGELLSQSGGPFLFGEFCAADAMFAPVATRLRTYDISVSPPLGAYVDAIYALPAFKRWQKAALAETWVVAEDEVEMQQQAQETENG